MNFIEFNVKYYSERVQNGLFSNTVCKNCFETVVDCKLNYELTVQGGRMKKKKNTEIISEAPLDYKG